MLDFNLAKKLKDAGFPQEPKFHGDPSGDVFVFTGSFYWFVKPEACVLPGFVDADEYQKWLQSASDPITPANNPPDLVKIPSLEELIEACGKDIFEIHKDWPVKDGIIWVAVGKLVVTISGEYESKGNMLESGETPAEAVANLWLELKNQ